MKKYKYSIQQYPFVYLLQNLFDQQDLSLLHKLSAKEYNYFDTVGQDSSTVFHNTFYEKMHKGWQDFIGVYDSFIRDFIYPMYSEPIIYQKWPTFRVHLPDNLAVASWHTDREFNHPKGEINYIIAITEMFESNTIITESKPNKRDFKQIELSPGEIFEFDGNQCTHGNLPNRTGKTRISLDFRILKKIDYNYIDINSSITTKTKFMINEYYKEL